MNKKIGLISIILTFILCTTFPSITATATTTIYVDPPTTTIYGACLGENFAVNVSIAEVTDLSVWDLILCYGNNVLNCVNVTEGPFLKAGGTHDTNFVSYINNTYNATHGRARAVSTITDLGPGVDGSGVLATIEFQINASGETTLHLTDTKLWNSSLSPPNSIDHNTTDGTVEIMFLPVGGIIISVNKLELLAPYVGLTILLAAAVVTVVYVKKRKGHPETNS
jgi:hypothetical protein